LNALTNFSLPIITLRLEKNVRGSP
jgi:hypothetical protein